MNYFLTAQSKLSPIASLVNSERTRYEEVDRYVIIGQEANTTDPSRNKSYSIFKFETDLIQAILQSNKTYIELEVKLNLINYKLELVEVDLFGIETATEDLETYINGKHYRGLIKGDNKSFVTASIYNNELYMIISSTRDGTLVIQRGKEKKEHIVYYDYELSYLQNNSYCSVNQYDKNEAKVNSNEFNRTNNCVSLYYELGHDIFIANNNDLETTFNWISSVHNNVAALFFNDEISVSLSQIFVWQSLDPYNVTNCLDQLNLFKQIRQSFNGDLGQFIELANDTICGRAEVINGLCDESEKYSTSKVVTLFPNVPEYSSTIKTITHEFGHLMGSQHTHDCVWGLFNDKAIDGCETPLLCTNPGYPQNGGTIMSYCNGISGVGVNFANGFGNEPSSRIRNRVNNANCLSSVCGPSLPLLCNSPTNNECYLPFPQTVIPISSFCNPETFSTCGATSSGFSSCVGQQDDDVFFSFTTPANTTSATITINSINQFDAVFQVLTGPCGTNMQELSCVNGTGPGGVESLTLTGLTANTQFYVRVWGFSNNVTANSHEFEICIVKCEQADLVVSEPSITPNTSQSNGTIDFSCNIINRGFSQSGSNTLKFYLSEDAELTENQNGDIFVDSYIITQDIPSNDTLNLSNIPISLPGSLANGFYYLYFWVDATNTVQECDDLNNFASSILTITTPISTTQPAYRIWYDANVAQSLVTNTTISSNELYDIQQSITTNTLSEGIHTLNFQFKDENNDWSSVLSSFFFKTNDKFPSGGPRYQYWFDNNFTLKVTNQIASTNTLLLSGNINSENISKGLHTFNIRFKPNGKHWSSVNSSFCYKSIVFPTGTSRYEYWFDQNYGNKVSVNNTSSNNFLLLLNLNLDTLSEGLHTFNIRFRPDGKAWSSISSSFFYKPRSLLSGIPKYEYWLDQNYAGKTSVNNTSTNNFILLDSIDYDTIIAGLHTFNIRFRPNGKEWSSVTSSFFYKPEELPSGTAQYEYWLDQNYMAKTTKFHNPANSMILLDSINYDTLQEGLHTFNIRFRPDGKTWSSITSNFFYKLKSAPTGQPKYQYWFDNQIQDSITITTTSSLDFILLDAINGLPLSEGLHTFNIRFKPTGGLWSAVNTSFFVRDKTTIGTEISKCVYWFDDNYPAHNTIYYSGSANVFDIIYAATPGLTSGEHTVSMFFMDNGGLWSSIVKDTFVRDTILPIQCPNNQLFTSGLGNPYNTDYQWQVNNGSGFTNLVNDTHHTGVNTDTLYITDPSPTWYGYTYQCVVTPPNGSNLYSQLYLLKFIYIWTGAIDTNWENPENWHCMGIPTEYSDVIINSGTVNVNSNPTIGSITLGSGVVFNLNEGKVFTTTGH